MYRTQFTDALRSLLRTAKSNAMDAILNHYGELLSASPDPRKREQIVEKIKNTPQLFDWAQSISQSFLKNKYPYLRLDDVDDITADATSRFLDTGLGQALDSWDWRGGSSLQGWIAGKIRWAAMSAKGGGLNTEKGHERDYELDARVKANPKFQSGESGGDVPPPSPLPPYVDYNRAGDTVDYERLLGMADEQLAKANNLVRANPGNQYARERILHIQEAKQELMARQKQEQQEDLNPPPYLPQNSGPGSRVVRRGPQAPPVQPSRLNPKFQRLDANDARIQEQATGDAYKGLSAHILQNAKVPAHLQKRLGLGKGRFFVNSLYSQHINVEDPKLQQTISQQMLAAMVDSKKQLDQTYKQRIVDEDTGKVTVRQSSEIRPIYSNNLSRRLQAVGVDPNVIAQVLQFVAAMPAHQLQVRIGDADEAMRFYQYEQAKRQSGKDTLAPEDIAGVADVAHKNMGYGAGTRMYARRAKMGPKGVSPDYDLSPLKPTFGEGDQRGFMRQEARNYFDPAISGLSIPNTLPYSSPHFISKISIPSLPLSQTMLDSALPAASPKSQGQGVAQQRGLTAEIHQLARLAQTLDSLGRLSAGDAADRIIRVTCTLSWV